eukprot:scaffold151298_cov27-Tisochrysis_lutea.AAC.1
MPRAQRPRRAHNAHAARRGLPGEAAAAQCAPVVHPGRLARARERHTVDARTHAPPGGRLPAPLPRGRGARAA